MGKPTNVAVRFIRSVFKRDQQVSDLSVSSKELAINAGRSFGSTSQFSAYNWLDEKLGLDRRLIHRYSDYEEMDTYGDISSCLDIYSDDATQTDSAVGHSVWVESQDETIKKELEDMFWKRLKIEEEIWPITRTLCAKGNDYEEIVVSDQGVIGLTYMPPVTVRRVEDGRGVLLGFVQSYLGELGNISPSEFNQMKASTGAKMGPGRDTAVFEDWRVSHMRLLAKHRSSMYGWAVTDAARWFWRRLMLLEDAVMVYKLTRSPSRYAFYIDVGKLPRKEAEKEIVSFMHKMKKKKFVNPNTGKLDMRFNPLPVAHDSLIPLLDGRTIPISEMSKEFEEGKKHWVYSVDKKTGNVVPGEVEWVGKTRESSVSVKLTFDDGTWMKMAPDHPVMRRNRKYIQAKDLSIGDRVMPFYRRVSSKSYGDSMHGYELVYDPEEKVYKYTHRIVSSFLGLHEPGQVIHHSSLDRRNNDPTKLEGMDGKEHRAMHSRMGQSGGAAIREMRKKDAALHNRIIDACRKNIVEYNRSDEHRKQTSILNRKRESKRFIIEYNASEKHEADNVVRSRAMSDFWKDPDKASLARERMKIKFPDSFIEGVRDLIRENPDISAVKLVAAINESVLLQELNEVNTRNIRHVYTDMLRGMHRLIGCETFNEFKESSICSNNHKVVAIEYDDDCDHYCMTVKKWHNFALVGFDGGKVPGWSSGVFVKNSMDEDFFFGSRDGKDSARVESLIGPNYQQMEDVMYFQNKLYAALKVPRAYLGYDENMPSKATLSQEDVRFARTILRVQREVRNGLHKIGRVNLAALNIDPAFADFSIKMTVPSSIFEMGQLEVRRAQADLASMMERHVSLHWILSNVYGLSDDEIKVISKQKGEEQAKAQSAEGGELESVMRLIGRGAKGLSERELMEGNREDEKRMEEAVRKVLSDPKNPLGRKLAETGALVRELAHTSRSTSHIPRSTSGLG